VQKRKRQAFLLAVKERTTVGASNKVPAKRSISMRWSGANLCAAFVKAFYHAESVWLETPSL
jgi:hypothetical protein